MITEKILQAYKDGKTIRSFFKSDEMELEMEAQGVSGARYSQKRCKGLDLDFVNRQELLDADWEIVKEMVPYYPVLLRIGDCDWRVSKLKYAKKEHFCSSHEYSHFKNKSSIVAICLLTEIPELIEYKEEET